MEPERDSGNVHPTLASAHPAAPGNTGKPASGRNPSPPSGGLPIPGWLIAVGVLCVGGAVATGYVLGGRAAGGPGASASGTRAWTGTVAKIARAGAASKDSKDDVVRARGPKGEDLSLAAGQKIGPGVELWTDAKSRARVELEDGTVLALDRQTRVRIEDGPRTLRVAEGVVMADVAHIDGAPPARLVTATGEVEVLGTKLALTATADRTSVEVLRGAVELKDGSQKLMIGAGQEGIAAKNAKLEMAPVQGLAQRLAFGEKLGFAGHNEDTDLPVSGLGELRARKPGRQDEKDRAVRLAAHRVKVRIAGSVARTEIDETFTNDADEELEGIYRFPLPPGAQIEKLSLEVDGKLVDGAFVDKAKGAAIWRGVIQNAAPKAPKPKEEIFWVPGPWRDPALLEWKRGGRFELRIFPIPKRGSRRIVISYTENVAPTAGVRRFTYPLPQSTSSDLRIGAFDLDVQVLGADPKQPVRARGYEVRRAEGEAGGVERFTMSERDFVPTGDLTVEYALADRASDVNAWAYTSSGAPSAPQDSFAAFALRPKFASWGESKPRDVAIVVDSGRAMFGERFQRARRLAVQIAQELDRRDRVTVLACDIACNEAPGSLESAGGQKAKSVAEFLAGIEPDGATDLVGALRRAAARKDATRDLRVILVSDGIASAGFRTPRRIEAETRDVLGDARSSLVAVPIGADADTRLLEGVARAGGGVVVPYAPGQTLEGTAVDVVTASYGVALRDVELTLPEGLVDTAPRVLPSIRPGGELVVTAKMTRDSVRGDAVLKGKVAGQPFEARYPLDVRATTNAGNAFVPRLFAAARISDMEDGARTDQERAEVVKLSQRFSVPSRLTSLLVLESEAMFNAFGIDRTQVAPTWTGETLADGTEVATLAKDEVGAGLGTLGTRSADAYDGESLGGLADKKEAPAGAGQGFGSGAVGRASKPKAPSAFSEEDKAAPAPATPPRAGTKGDLDSAQPMASAAPRDDAAPAKRRSRPSVSSPWGDPSASCACRANDPGCTCLRGQTFMKRIWVRRAAIAEGAPPAVNPQRITVARAQLASAPDERNKHRDFARLLSANGSLEELGEVLARWSGRDPMDVDVTAMRADLAARSGDRARALRVLSGVAASGQADVSVLEALAQSNERAGESEPACAFRVAVADARIEASKGVLPAVDLDRVARAMACEDKAGRSVRRWFDEGVKDTAGLDRAFTKAKTDAGREDLRGDLVVEATWDAGSGADVDVAIVDPTGVRYSWVTRSKSVRVQDATSRTREVLALQSTGTGPFTIEVTRASGTGPVRGQLTIRAMGERTSFPFVLNGPFNQVGRVNVRVEEQFIPVNDPGNGPIDVFRR